MEVEELVRGDVEWWPGFCAALAEEGQAALVSETRMRGWSWGALWKWIVGDVTRYSEYMQALEAYVQAKGLETVGIADGATAEDVAVAKLQVDTRFKLAGKVDRARWGDKVAVDAGGVAVVDAGLVMAMGELLGRLSGQRAEKVIGAGVENSTDAVEEAHTAPDVGDEI